MNPSLEGKKIVLWRVHANYLLYPLSKSIDANYEVGFRMNTIISSWSCIESFIRSAMYEIIAVKYNDLEISKPGNFKNCFYKLTFKLKWLFKSENEKFDYHISRKTKLLNSLSKEGFNSLLKTGTLIGKDIKKDISNDSWAFIQNLYRLRNAFTHGQDLTIQKSNTNDLKNYINNEYNKSLKYLNGKNIIKYNELFVHFDESKILNKVTTDFVIENVISCMDELSIIFDETMEATVWKKSRNK